MTAALLPAKAAPVKTSTAGPLRDGRQAALSLSERRGRHRAALDKVVPPDKAARGAGRARRHVGRAPCAGAARARLFDQQMPAAHQIDRQRPESRHPTRTCWPCPPGTITEAGLWPNVTPAWQYLARCSRAPAACRSTTSWRRGYRPRSRSRRCGSGSDTALALGRSAFWTAAFRHGLRENSPSIKRSVRESAFAAGPSRTSGRTVRRENREQLITAPDFPISSRPRLRPPLQQPSA